MRYCKAYYLRDIKKFSRWADLCESAGAYLQDDDIVYVQDDFSLVKNPAFPDADSLLRAVTPEWQQFCQQVLQFSVPEESLKPAEEHAVTAGNDQLYRGNR
ncbi:MAG TPA: hypothetical protein VFV38_04185 [Ktedonobacteraceae bacterium]|nr:hypothetical protein [Ktedonobacteraceae bacterium]